MQLTGKTNSINNYYKNPVNIDSNTGDVNLYAKLNTIDSEIAALGTTNTNYIDTTGVVLTSDNFNQTILVDTQPNSAAIAITAPNPNGLTDQSITFVNSPNGIFNVTVTTPTGTFGSASPFSTIILYPGDSIKLMTLSAFGYQCLNLSRASGLGNVVVAHFPTAQVLTLGSVPQTLVSAPGANSFIWTNGGNVRINSTGHTAFAAGAALALKMGTTQVRALGVATFVTQAADSLLVGFTAYVTTTAQAAATIMNQPLVLGTTGNADFTTGTGSLDIAVEYSIITFL